MTDDRLTAIERKLDEHGKTLRGIQGTLERVAVQHEQITSLQRDVSKLWQKWDDLTNPKGTLARLSAYQASCPRGQIKYLWCLIIPQGLTLIGVAVAVMAAVL